LIFQVKGLAEMTNQNTPLQHDTDHEPSERLRSSSAQHHLQHHHQQQLHTQTSVDHELSTSKQQRLANSEYSPSPPTRQSHHQRASISPPPTLSATTTTSGSYYNISRKNHRGSGENHMNLHHHDTSSSGAIKTESGTGGRSSVGGGSEGDGDGGGRSASISVISGNCDENLNNDEPMVTNDTKLRLHSPNDERMSIKKDGEIGELKVEATRCGDDDLLVFLSRTEHDTKCTTNTQFNPITNILNNNTTDKFNTNINITERSATLVALGGQHNGTQHQR
jgi:hypothetical protein